ncbi:hypothetical protein RAD15_19390 [Bradyrhizobium sp. 14AA]
MLHASALSVRRSLGFAQLVLEATRGGDGVIRLFEQGVSFDWRVHDYRKTGIGSVRSFAAMN